MSVNTKIITDAAGFVKDIGGATAHYLYPNDFDTYYMMALELVDSENNTVEYFSFPIMPDNYSNKYTSPVNIDKTAGSVLSTKGSGFIPRNISISGNFGRQFKFIIGESQVSATAWRFSTNAGNFGGDMRIKINNFMVGYKSGYGAVKVLEAILYKASQLDNNGYPYKLYFYNPSFGESYLVEVKNVNFSQDISKNLIWQYNLTFVALGLINNNEKGLSTAGMVGYDLISKSLNIATNQVRILSGRL